MTGASNPPAWVSKSVALICGEGKEAAPSVAGALVELAHLISTTASEAKKADETPPPKRAEAREALTAIRHHAVMLRWALTRAKGQAALRQLSSAVRLLPPNEADIGEHLADLSWRARLALRRIPDHRGGKDRLGESSKLTIQQLTARCVVRVWERVHGEAPAQNNRNAWDVCWLLLAGATPTKLAGQAWERHLESVMPLPGLDTRQRLDRWAAIIATDMDINPIIEAIPKRTERYSGKTRENRF